MESISKLIENETTLFSNIGFLKSSKRQVSHRMKAILPLFIYFM